MSQNTAPRGAPYPEPDTNFELLARLCPDGVLVCKDGVIVYANAVAGALLDNVPERLIGLPVPEVVMPECRQVLRQRLEQAAAGISGALQETSLRRVDGSPLDTEIASGPLTWDGMPAALLLVRDVFQSKRTATRLQASESRLSIELGTIDRLHALGKRLLATRDLHHALDEVLDAAIALLDADYGNIQLYDPPKKGLEMVVQRGFPQAFLDFFKLVSADDDCACGHALRSGERIIIEDVQTNDEYVNLRDIAAAAGYRAVQSTPLLTAAGEMLGMLSTHFRSPHRPSEHQLRVLDLYVLQAIELVDRLRKEQALRESEDRFRRALQPANVGIVFLDNRGAIHEANDAFLRMSGYAHEDVAAGTLSWENLTVPERRAAAGRTIAEFHNNGQVAPCEHASLRKDGSRWDALCSVTRIGEDEGVGYMIDISDRKRAERALKDADRRKDEFLATLAHELRNPLAPISNAMHLLKAGPLQRRSGDRLIGVVQRQVKHIVRLVDDLMEVSRITRGKIELRRAPVALSESLLNAIETNRPLFERRRQRLHVAIPPEPLTLDADGVRLTQVFANLLHNAAKYTGDDGDIWLEARRAGQEAQVAVRDTGIGIAPQLLPRVFEMFVQGEHGSGEQGGLGIGLTMARNLLELHGGTIEARSEGLGHGAEFVVHLPLLPDDAARQRSAPARTTPLAGQRVLVVDDNHDAADSLAMLLAACGADVRVAYGGQQALEVLDDYQPHAAVLDLGMPGMSGYELAERIRRAPRHAGLKLVALTGWGQNADRVHSRASGFDAHLTKPGDIDALTAIIKGPPAS
jgi:PAS domain S-box-containing protein